MAPSELAEGLGASLATQRNIRPTFGYYRQPNGWITASPITRLERVKYIERGWQHLGQYGAFDMSPYAANHPLDALFMFGGAKEMPVDQIIQMGFHLNPPLVPGCRMHLTQLHPRHTANCFAGAKPVEFPQLAGVDPVRLRAHRCEFCDRVLPTPEARKQHEQVVHKEELGHMQAGRSLATAIADGKPSVVAASPAPVAAGEAPDVSALLERIASLEKREKEREKNRVRTSNARAAKKNPENLSAPR